MTAPQTMFVLSVIVFGVGAVSVNVPPDAVVGCAWKFGLARIFVLFSIITS